MLEFVLSRYRITQTQKCLPSNKKLSFSTHSSLEIGGVGHRALPHREGPKQDDQAGREGTVARRLYCSFQGKEWEMQGKQAEQAYNWIFLITPVSSGV